MAMLILTLWTDETNYLELFDWGSTTIDSIIFLIGSAYFCAGSYPYEVRSCEHRQDNDKSSYRKGTYDHNDPENAPLLNQGPPKQDGNDGKRS